MSGDEPADPVIDFGPAGSEDRTMEVQREVDYEMPADRLEESQPQCPFGVAGSCCDICYMGPCRVSDDDQYGQDRGVCGATPGTVVSRNLYREIAGGVSAHSHHAREAVELLEDIAEENAADYEIKDERKLRDIAEDLGLDADGEVNEIAKDVAEAAKEDFAPGGGETLNWVERMPAEQREHLDEQDLLPLSSVDQQASRALAQTHQGNDSDTGHILKSALSAGVADGYAGLTMATDLQDVIFGTPTPTNATAHLGVLEEDQVNLAVHGHSPELSEMVVKAAQELEEEAYEVGAEGINLVGICCTGNELAERHGIPLAAHSLQSELAVTTGAVDAMVVDIQCIWPGISDLMECHHTRLITTMDYVRMREATHIPFEEETAMEDAKEIVRQAIEGYEDRQRRQKYDVNIPDRSQEAVVGFSDTALLDVLETIDPDNPAQPIVDAIQSGQLRGIVGIVGCPNPKMREAQMSENLIENLLAADVLPVVTGCIGHIMAQGGYLDPGTVDELAGDGIRDLLYTLGDAAGLDGPLPPVLHMGSCVDNSRIGNVIRAISEGSGIPTRDLPVAASAPELIAEKAVSIGTWALSLGLPLHTAPGLRIEASDAVTQTLTEDLKDITGGHLIQDETPDGAAEKLIDALDERREPLLNASAAGASEGTAADDD
ncbi:anaerobic carbon-monoxide dehydrogenase catalytic subunit [Halapricum desulfuricans]|uniref:Carbon monoxide dehydrogenase n=1 Tax=Halapricum desulfuricans TaxID=2841257 RepID=A0A897N527_9EURY|nr:anaerobic carbon-monoxide dehydrogenase catalytic subunit [Halapricum desulfuricans]QSG06169.1 Hydroxylamine reductase, 6Fe-6S prismane cluster-containing protein [Halapricum desulfuricans]